MGLEESELLAPRSLVLLRSRSTLGFLSPLQQAEVLCALIADSSLSVLFLHLKN